eukprot:TRINITY_DN755_c0_g1_i12.p1 TRINITY_DN755_c0_g1~~TRINITY_DN755_c0_g1_i12.p1  ORF type:complete len:121 (-),score=15.88 TRINITY_DN755_c0_g1_i12:142-504(-)
MDDKQTGSNSTGDKIDMGEIMLGMKEFETVKLIETDINKNLDQPGLEIATQPEDGTFDMNMEIESTIEVMCHNQLHVVDRKDQWWDQNNKTKFENGLVNSTVASSIVGSVEVQFRVSNTQ